jgi:hypothetical protein
MGLPVAPHLSSQGNLGAKLDGRVLSERGVPEILDGFIQGQTQRNSELSHQVFLESLPSGEGERGDPLPRRLPG